MTKQITRAVDEFTLLILQVKNSLYYHTNIVERTIRAQQKLTTLIFEQILLDPQGVARKEVYAIEHRLIDQVDACLFYLVDKNGNMPVGIPPALCAKEPVDVYLMNYIHEKLFEIIDFLDDYHDVVVPSWYEVIS